MLKSIKKKKSFLSIGCMSLCVFLVGKSFSEENLIHGWSDYFKDSQNWVTSGDLVFFPGTSQRDQDAIYTFFIDNSFFGNVKNRVFSGIYTFGNRQSAIILGNQVHIPRINQEGGTLSKIQAVGGNGNDYFSMCYITIDPHNPLQGSTLFGDKPWPAGDYPVPCAQNVVAVQSGMDRLGALQIGHQDQTIFSSTNSVISRETFGVSSGELSVTLRAPFGYGLTPKVSLVVQEDSLLSEVQVFSADGKWTLPVVSGMRFANEKYENQYLNVDDDLTSIHQYKVHWNQIGQMVQFVWSLNDHAYASKIVTLDHMPKFKIKVQLDAKKNDQAALPISKESDLSVFDIRLSKD